MDQGLLVFILSVLVFVLGAVFINYSVKRDEAKEAQKAEVTASASKSSAAKLKKAA